MFTDPVQFMFSNTSPSAVLTDALENFRKRTAPQIKKILIPAFRIREFQEEISLVTGIPETRAANIRPGSCSLFESVPISLDTTNPPELFSKTLALVLFHDGNIGVIESKRPLVTQEDHEWARQETEYQKCRNIETPVRLSSIA